MLNRLFFGIHWVLFLFIIFMWVWVFLGLVVDGRSDPLYKLSKISEFRWDAGLITKEEAAEKRKAILDDL
jgi:hypothetical protein